MELNHHRNFHKTNGWCHRACGNSYPSPSFLLFSLFAVNPLFPTHTHLPTPLNECEKSDENKKIILCLSNHHQLSGSLEFFATICSGNYPTLNTLSLKAIPLEKNKSIKSLEYQRVEQIHSSKYKCIMSLHHVITKTPKDVGFWWLPKIPIRYFISAQGKSNEKVCPTEHSS